MKCHPGSRGLAADIRSVLIIAEEKHSFPDVERDGETQPELYGSNQETMDVGDEPTTRVFKNKPFESSAEQGIKQLCWCHLTNPLDVTPRLRGTYFIYRQRAIGIMDVESYLH